MLQAAVRNGFYAYRWQPYEQISPDMALAVIAAEDQRFPMHSGFDIDAINAALRDAEEGASLRGASTITQQVAKNLFLWPGRSFCAQRRRSLADSLNRADVEQAADLGNVFEHRAIERSHLWRRSRQSAVFFKFSAQKTSLPKKPPFSPLCSLAQNFTASKPHPGKC